jgi:hypothetical protein
LSKSKKQIKTLQTKIATFRSTSADSMNFLKQVMVSWMSPYTFTCTFPKHSAAQKHTHKFWRNIAGLRDRKMPLGLPEVGTYRRMLHIAGWREKKCKLNRKSLC